MAIQSAAQARQLVSKKVSIASVSQCPPIETQLVQVLCRQGVSESLRTIGMKRPTRFDELITVVVDEISSQPHLPPAPIRSGKDVLRWFYTQARDASARYGEILRFDQPILDTRIHEPNNVAHLVNCLIPMCLHARKSVGDDVLYIFGKIKMEKARELLSKFNIRPIETHKRIAGPVVHIRGTRGLAVFNLPPFDDDIISFFPEIYDEYSFKSTIKIEKVFLARRGARALDNQVQVEDLLTMAGYKTVYMEDHSIKEQISIAANARHVVAVHGAAMAFLTFNRAIESVIELFPPHVYHEYFAVTLGNRVHNYILVIQDFDERVVHSGWDAISHFKNQPFTADIALLQRALLLSRLRK
jgi:hypothetical protein